MRKKLLFAVISVFVISALLVIKVYAYDDNLTQSIEDSFFEGMDEEVSSVLDNFGVDSLHGEEIFTEGFNNIKKYFSETLKDKIEATSGWFVFQISILMLLSVFSNAFDYSMSDEACSIITVTVLVLSTVGKISEFLNCTVSAISMNNNFMLSFIPVFTVLVSLSGNPTSAVTYNSFLFFFCEVTSFIIENLFVDIIGICFAVSISFCYNPVTNINRFTNAISKMFTIVLGLAASIFTGLLSLKNVLAYATDSISVKGVKFLIGSLIPVIGSSLSEAYSSVLGSINLMKSSLAVIGIFSLTVINIPVFIEGLVYYFSMSVISVFAEMLGLIKASEIMRCFSVYIKILLLICLFQVFILIISAGIMLMVKGGAYG